MRSIFISDIHIGSKHANILGVNKILENNELKYVYLVGDIIDFWKIEKHKFHWKKEIFDFVRILGDLANSGCKIIYIVGNHDHLLRDKDNYFKRLLTSHINVRVADEAIHLATDGKRYLIIHGDKFDLISKHGIWLEKAGDFLYDYIIDLNSFIVRLFRLKRFSLSKAIKKNVKQAAQFISNYKNAIKDYCLELNVDGCISGHIHSPEDIDLAGFRYLNCGDFVENYTYLAEEDNGTIRIYSYSN